MVLTAIVFLLILSVLVLIHEAGHYFMAKLFGIKVEEFGFGLPLLPKIFSFKRGETEYSIYPALIGGFVKLYGEDEAGAGRVNLKVQKSKVKGEDENRAFYSRSVGQRAIVVVAGVVMNAVLAVIIYYVYLSLLGFSSELPLLSNHKFLFANQVQVNINRTDRVIASVSETSPLQKFGMKPPFRVTAVNNKPVKDVDEFIKLIEKNKGKSIVIAWQEVGSRDNALVFGNKHEVAVVPRMSPPKNEGPLGVGFFPIVFITYDTMPQRLFSGIIHPINLMSYNFDVLGSLIKVSIQEKNIKPVSQGVSGPVGIATVVGAVLDIPNLRERILELLNLVGILSVSLAFFNVLPIPGLDGGRLFFILIEGVFGLKINPKVEGYINTIGMAFLFLLIILITYKDIMQQFVK
jgi:regulator of sigma E protease